jgi:hypothetical protein
VAGWRATDHVLVGLSRFEQLLVQVLGVAPREGRHGIDTREFQSIPIAAEVCSDQGTRHPQRMSSLSGDDTMKAWTTTLLMLLFTMYPMASRCSTGSGRPVQTCGRWRKLEAGTGGGPEAGLLAKVSARALNVA